MPPELGACDPAAVQQLALGTAAVHDSGWQEPLEMPSPDLHLQVTLCVRTVLLACQLGCKNLELINSAFRSWELFPGPSFVALGNACSCLRSHGCWCISCWKNSVIAYTNNPGESPCFQRLIACLPLAPTPSTFCYGLRSLWFCRPTPDPDKSILHLQVGLPLTKEGITKKNIRKRKKDKRQMWPGVTTPWIQGNLKNIPYL